MKEQAYSRTADSMAIIRAMEYTGRKSADRILSDPWAEALIQNRWAQAMVKYPLLVRIISAISAIWIPGGQEYVLVRARLVDDLTVEFAGQGLEQLVILGAGFDTTAFRLSDYLGEVEIFEVDHPATQLAKRKSLAKTVIPRNVHFTSVDFEKDDLVDRLTSSGFEPTRRSLITWMGVSYYLTGPAVAKTLGQIAGLCSPGSRLVFDYAIESTIADPRSRAARLGIKHAARVGEPFLFGLDPARVNDYLMGFGFDFIEQYDWLELQSRYCPPGRTPVDFTFIAVCVRR